MTKQNEQTDQEAVTNALRELNTRNRQPKS